MADRKKDTTRALPDEVKTAVRSMWALGDYSRFTTVLDSQLGRDLVEACAIGAGQRVLDVAGANAGPLEGPTELRFEYLLVLARKRS